MNDFSIKPKNMPIDTWMDHIHDITGIGPAGDTKWRPCSYEERNHKAGQFLQSVQAYMERPQKEVKKKVQAFWTTADLPDPVSNSFGMLTDMVNTDQGWQLAFKDASGNIESGRDFWEVLVHNEAARNGWQIVPEGHSVQLQEITGTLNTIKVYKFGSGIGWTDEMIRFRRAAAMIQLAEDFVMGYQRDKADRFYALMASAAANNVIDFQDGGTALENNISTINLAAFTLLDNLKNTRNLPASTEILLYVNPQAQANVLRALGEVSQAVVGSQTRVVYNVRPIFTFNDSIPAAQTGGANFGAIMTVPGYLNQWAQLLEPMSVMQQDALSLSQIQTWWSYYGGACLDTNQWVQLDIQ